MTTIKPTPNGKSDKKDRRYVRRPSPSAMGGAMFGGVMGSALGPLGAATGLVIGGLVGEAVDRHYGRDRESAHSAPAD